MNKFLIGFILGYIYCLMVSYIINYKNKKDV